MKRLNIPMAIWAARDALRRPAESLLLMGALCAVVTVLGTSLTLSHALSSMTVKLVDSGPSLVIRKLNAGGWSPIPVIESLSVCRSVPGVLEARPRVWGTVMGPEGPLTVMGIDSAETIPDSSGAGISPEEGKAVVGPGISTGEANTLSLKNGRIEMNLTVIGRLPSKASMAAHDVVFLHPDDARRILGLPAGFASDLAVEVFHVEEEQAILPDLADAFPWPVRITTRTEMKRIYSSGYFRRGSITLVAAVPSVLSLILLTAAVGRMRLGGKYEAGLYKAFGWTTGEIVSFQMYRALVVGIPSVALGMALSYCLVYLPEVSWIGSLLLGWTDRPPRFYLDPEGAILLLIETAGLCFLPYLAAVFWTSLKIAGADPQDLLERGSLC